MNQETYRSIISGKDHRLAAALCRILLRMLSLIYSVVVRIRNGAYTFGILRSRWVSVPVVSIGNITAGGTGKTPLVIWLCNYLHHKGIRSCILTRGYKTEPGQITDEPALLAKACPGSAVIVNPNRLAGARKAIRTHQPAVLVLDDGFQHRKLRRNLDILVIDATCPFGYERLLPAGLLREPLSGLSRTSAIVITRTDQADAQTIRELHAQITRYAPNIPVAKTVHKLSHAVSYPNQAISLDTLRKERIYAFCGIGNPDAFFGSIRQHGLTLRGTQIFDDHHVYTASDMEQVYAESHNCGASVVLCTQKDWVKSALLVPTRDAFVFAYLAMELDFVDGSGKITSLVDMLFDLESTKKGTSIT